MNAMIFAAGLGSRLYPLTKYKPKALVEVQGKPLLDHCIQKLSGIGVHKIVVNVHHFAPQILAHINKSDYEIPIIISYEKDKLLETGGGLKFASKYLLDGPTLLYNVDILSNIDLNGLIEFHSRHKPMASLVVRNRDTQRYLLFDSSKRLIGWKNIKTQECINHFPKLDFSSLAFSGIHIIDPEIFSFMPDKDKFSMIELYLELSKQHNILAFVDEKSNWVDVGKPDDLNKMNK